jgi:hypothetical protein
MGTEGDDANAGTWEEPFATAERLLGALAPGQTGCIKTGVYDQVPLHATQGGAPGAPITLTSAPLGRATLGHRIWLERPGSHLVLENLVLRASHDVVSPMVTMDNVVFRNNDITHALDYPCLLIGTDAAATNPVRDVVIEKNRIHGCGGGNGMTLGHAIRTVVRDNWIYDNGDKGISFNPGESSVVERNVIDAVDNALYFGGQAGGYRASGNVVRWNTFSNTRAATVHSAWPEALGTGNLVEENCFFATGTTYFTSNAGYTEQNNLFDQDPRYVNRPARDFTLQAGSPCAGKAPAAPPGF